ncbi:MAG: Frizzy aggregation protein FrzB [Myxococcaceae bacterium]|jgi:chemotaxis signal transduction protein|nr:Frizzy aggregation protein FrzB [Myxococcaceae bacterium]
MSERAELVIFEIAGRRFGADMTQVRRIDRLDVAASVGAPLGRVHEGRRALVFSPDGERELHLAIDAVAGVQAVSSDELRRLPTAVGPSPLVIGAWLDRDAPVLLIDLYATQTSTAPEGHHA